MSPLRSDESCGYSFQKNTEIGNCLQMIEAPGPSPKVHPRTLMVHGPRLKTLEVHSTQKIWARKG